MEDFKITIPAQLVKGDEEGYKIMGLASTESMDRQGEIIMQKGIDLSPVDEGKGFFNFDHSNKPEDIIGVIDSYKQEAGKGLFVKGSLFKGHQRAEAVRAIMKGLKDRNTGAVGFSVEGKILERDPQNPKIIKKCQIKNVALTFNPVNSETYAHLVKSMAANSLEFDSTKENNSNTEKPQQNTFTADQVLSIVEKALAISPDVGTVAPNTLSGGSAMVASDMKPEKKKKKKDEEESTEDKPEQRKLKIMTKSEYVSSLVDILDQLQELHPNCSRNDLWSALQDRLTTKYPKIDIKI